VLPESDRPNGMHLMNRRPGPWLLRIDCGHTTDWDPIYVKVWTERERRETTFSYQAESLGPRAIRQYPVFAIRPHHLFAWFA